MLQPVKKFVESLNLINLVFTSLLAGLLSLKLGFLHPYLQFICVSSSGILFGYIAGLKSDHRYFDHLVSLVALLPILIISVESLLEVTAVFMILSVFALPLGSGKISMYSIAFQAHMADMYSTLLALPYGGEVNPLLENLISSLGKLPALLTVKVGLIAFLLTLIYNKVECCDEKFLLNIIALIGFSMAARNLLIFLA